MAEANSSRFDVNNGQIVSTTFTRGNMENARMCIPDAPEGHEILITLARLINTGEKLQETLR